MTVKFLLKMLFFFSFLSCEQPGIYSSFSDEKILKNVNHFSSVKF